MFATLSHSFIFDTFFVTHLCPLLLCFSYCSLHRGPVLLAGQGHALHPLHAILEARHDVVEHALLHAHHPVDLQGAVRAREEAGYGEIVRRRES